MGIQKKSSTCKMKVIIEEQYVCTPTPWGIPYYAIQLTNKLLERNKFNYGLTFFDQNKERNNRKWIEKYFGNYAVPIYECNELSYRTAFSDKYAFSEKSYNVYTGAEGDVFHFLQLISIPDNLKGASVVTVHDMLPVKFPEFYSTSVVEWFNLGIERLNKIQPTVIADSTATKKDILEFTKITSENIHVIPLAYDEKKSSVQKSADVIKELGIAFPYILYLGRVDIRKNIVRLIEAFESISSKYSDVKLVIAGEPHLGSEEVALKVKNSKYKSRIIMPGYVSDEQKHALYSEALAFIFTSLYEGFGLPLLEAMTCGSPVITSNVSSMPEVAGDAAILVDPYRVEQLAHEIERVISSKSLQEELRNKGFAQSKKFSWSKTAEMTEEVYRIAVAK